MLLRTPTKLYFSDEFVQENLGELEELLSYQDKRVSHELRKYQQYKKDHLKAEEKGGCHWFVAKYGEEALEFKIQELTEQQNQSTLKSDSGGYYTYSGLAPLICEKFGLPLPKQTLPPPEEVEWTPPPFSPRWYQAEAVKKMVEQAKHGPACVELATGLGKSLIISMLVKKIGRSAVVIAPFVNIAEQLLADLKERFGEKNVGQFFGGKKQSDRKYVVAVSKSLMNCSPDDKHWDNLVTKDVLVGDEAHLLPSDTLSKVILDMLGDVPYRFFLSGTILRTDGLEKLLEGIVGKKLMKMDVRKGVEGEFLSRPQFVAFKVPAAEAYTVKNDPIKMNRFHLHKNELVYKHAAKVIKAGLKRGLRVLVLVEQLHQFSLLEKQLVGVSMRFAHGGVTAKNKEDIDQKHWKSKPLELVKQFDAGEFEVLVGTSCIGTGTDIKSASLIIDLVGGSAEIRVRQNVGRGTRLFPGKKKCVYVVYDIHTVPSVHRQFLKLKKILDNIHGPVEVKEAYGR